MILESNYKRLLDSLKTGVMLLDNDLHLHYINMAAESLLEISDRQANRQFLGEIFIGANEDINEIKAALATNTSFTKHRTELRLANGKSIIVDYTLNSFYEADEMGASQRSSNNTEAGKPQALLELHSLHQAQRISREETFISTHATTREMVRGLAHEIKNPLGGIRGAAQLLAQELPDDELKDYTNVIIEEADRLHNLVDRLVGSRKLPDMKALNIHEVLERVKSLVEAEINKEAISLIRDYDPSIPAIQGDSEQLIQAMLNIVRNAMQALASPGVDHNLGKIYLKTRILRNVTIGANFHRLAVGISVIDNGPGIHEDLLDTVFYPMISGRANGSGLGLSITHAIISQHKGMIECQSRPGATCFTVYLPLI